MPDDATLLHRYATTRDDAAFAEFVQRHVALVYSAALRQLAGDEHLARDATQLVFIAVARKARPLSIHPLLTGWLYTATHHAATKLVRGEQRRRAHEKNAHAMNTLSPTSSTAPTWEQLRPLLDTALRELSEPDRAAVLLRFFENRSFAEVGERLNLSDDTARKRVERALAKLHAALSRRGIVSTTTALAAAISTHGIHAAPIGLAQAVATIAVKTAATTGIAAATVSFFASAKVPLGLAAAIIVVSTPFLVKQQKTLSTLRAEVARLNSHVQTSALTLPTALARLAASQRPFPRSPSDASRLVAEQERERTTQQAIHSYERIWAPVIRRLQLQRPAVEALVRLELERMKAMSLARAMAGDEGGLSKETIRRHYEILLQAATTGFQPRFCALLGDEGFAYFEFFRRTSGARQDLDGFATTVANTDAPLSDEQMDRLAELLTEARAGTLAESNGVALLISPIFVAQAAPLLTPSQLAKLTQLQAARAAAREIDARNRIAAASGQLRLSAASSAEYLTPMESKTP